VCGFVASSAILVCLLDVGLESAAGPLQRHIGSLAKRSPLGCVDEAMRGSRPGCAGLLASILVLILPAIAAAAGFSAPVALPASYGREWNFAVNDRGAGGAVTNAPSGALFYPIGAEGPPGAAIALAVPGNYPSFANSIAINEQGRVAVAFVFRDATTPPSEVEHGGPGCCGRVAAADWQLGQQAPPVQLLSPRQSGNGASLQVRRAPSLVVGRSAITVLWTREEENSFEASTPMTKLLQAYGRFAEPLHVKQLASAPRGIPERQLSLAGNGQPMATWLEDQNKLLSVDGRLDGSLGGPFRIRRVPHLSVAKGFASETGTAQRALFPYFTNLSPNGVRSQINTIERWPHQPFGRTRHVATIVGATSTSFAVGPHTVLALWEKSFSFVGKNHLYTQLWDPSSSHPKTQSLGLGEDATGFIDGRGRAVIVYSRPARNRGSDELVAATTGPDQRFAPARPIAAGLGRCTFEREEEFNPLPLATSPDGHAIFEISCEGADGAEHQYMVRYSP
jgi:hypothetical protein